MSAPPPPVTPPLSTTPPAAQPAAATDRPAGTETTLEATIEPVNVDFAERPHNPMAVIAASSSGNASTETAFRLAGYGTSLQRVDVGGGDLLGEGLRHSDGRASGLSQSGERGRSAAELTLAQDLEALRDTLGEQDDEFQNRGTVALAAGSLSMTLAYLLWLVRGGALVASALSALPAWRMLDPLPVLTRVSDDEDEEEGEVDDDEAIASFAAHPAGTRQ